MEIFQGPHLALGPYVAHFWYKIWAWKTLDDVLIPSVKAGLLIWLHHRLQSPQDAALIWVHPSGGLVRPHTRSFGGWGWKHRGRGLPTPLPNWRPHHPADLWAQRRVALRAKWTNRTVRFVVCLDPEHIRKLWSHLKRCERCWSFV